ncbi:hypothetical protein SBRCBS47491_007193 [Sporothrix bragantina]|uniref:Major facilitator superfamily transporter n=1 Tax=Sporothrix bragantina TaxID=671064 RepID=A0ABP0CBJ1_9PEZI
MAILGSSPVLSDSTDSTPSENRPANGRDSSNTEKTDIVVSHPSNPPPSPLTVLVAEPQAPQAPANKKDENNVSHDLATSLVSPKTDTASPSTSKRRFCRDKNKKNKKKYTHLPWLVVLGGVCLTMPTYGLMSAFGLFQVYWETHQLQGNGYDDATISWIGSLLGFLNCLFGLVSGVLLDRFPSPRGLAWQLVPSSLVYWASFLALAWCSTYAGFMACMVVAGISSALPSTAAFVVVDRIFEMGGREHGALATGIVSTGVPLGGLMVSLMLRALLARTAANTWPVSMFWLSSVIGFQSLVGCILVIWGGCIEDVENGGEEEKGGPDGDVRGEGSTIETSVRVTKTEEDGSGVETAVDHGKDVQSEAHSQPQERKCVQPQDEATAAPPPTHPPKTRLAAACRHLSHFTDRGFWMFTLCVFVFEFVLYTQWGSLPYYAARTGLGDVFYFQMVYNIGALPGRTLPSWLAARFGPFNVTLATTALTIFTVFVVWVPFGDHSPVALYAVSFLMGVGTGSFTPLVATCLSRLCNGRGFGTWLGTCYALVSVASLLGSPVNQALLDKTGPRFSVCFQGILLAVAFFLCVLVRRQDMLQRQRQRQKIAMAPNAATGAVAAEAEAEAVAVAPAVFLAPNV